MAWFRRSVTTFTAIAVSLGIAACDKVAETLDPCAGEHACEIDGVDLIVSEISLNVPTVSELNKPVVPVGATIEVSYAILNRGSENSTVADFDVCLGGSSGWTSIKKSVEIPALKPGEGKNGKIELVLPQDAMGDWAVVVRTDYSDSDRFNNSDQVDFLIEGPDLIATMSPLADEVQVGTEIPVVITVKNQAYVASAEESTAHICVGYGNSCDQGFDPVQVKTQSLKAGGVQVDTIPFLVPLSVLYWHDEARSTELAVCADTHGTVSEGGAGKNNNCTQRPFTVLPNLDLACNVGDIAPGQTRSGTITAADCDGLKATRSETDLYKFTAAANEGFIVDIEEFSSTEGYSDEIYFDVLTARGILLSGTRSGATHTFTVGQAGTYYLAVSTYYSARGQTYTFKFSNQ